MPFEKGISGNPAGKPKGAVNTQTKLIKNLVETLISDNVDTIRADFAALKGREKINALCDLLPYVIPKLQATTLDIEIESLTDEQLDALYDRIVNQSKK
jgi:hypothetical protein